MKTKIAAFHPKKIKIAKISLWVVTFLIVAIWAIPFFFMIITSLKSNADVFGAPPFALPSTLNWANYLDAVKRVDLLRAIWHSTTIAIIKVPIGLFISAMAAYAITRLKVPFPRGLLVIFVLGTLVPIQVALGTLFEIIYKLGLLSTQLGIILPYIAFGVPYQVFILSGFFEAIPTEMDEAARIDGANNFRLFWSIILPLAKPALAALFILDFVATWNEYSMALVILQRQESWTVPLSLQGFSSAYQTFYGPLNAAIIMSILPVVIIYLLFQRYFVEGMYAGAVKG
jgi:raffinose/stachyose/melibiose transport system permease protein